MEKNGIGYLIKGIEIISKQINAISAEKLNRPVSFTLKIEFKVKAEAKCVIPIIDIEAFDEASKFKFASYQIALVFEITDFDKNIIANQNGLYEIPMELQSPLQAVSISTARGILYSEFKGTYLGNAILPIVDVASLQRILPDP